MQTTQTPRSACTYATDLAWARSTYATDPTLTLDDRGRPTTHGPRDVDVATFDTATGEALGTETWSHWHVLALLSDYLDQIDHGEVPDLDGTLRDVAMAAYALVFEDWQTGVSIAASPTFNDLIDRALTWATTVDDAGTRVETSWKRF